jgi:hypothetical protein
MLNIALPIKYFFLRKEFMYQRKEEYCGQFIPCIVYAACSMPGKVMMFHVLTNQGVLFSRVPLHALAWKEGAPLREPWELCFWDCFGYEVTYDELDYITDGKVEVFNRKREFEKGNIIGSFDWINNGFSDEPSQHKIMHWIKLADGNFGLYPNNRMKFEDIAFTTAPFPEKPDFLVNNSYYSVENDWDSGNNVNVLGDSDEYFYD